MATARRIHGDGEPRKDAQDDARAQQGHQDHAKRSAIAISSRTMATRTRTRHGTKKAGGVNEPTEHAFTAIGQGDATGVLRTPFIV